MLHTPCAFDSNLDELNLLAMVSNACIQPVIPGFECVDNSINWFLADNNGTYSG